MAPVINELSEKGAREEQADNATVPRRTVAIARSFLVFGAFTRSLKLGGLPMGLLKLNYTTELNLRPFR